jgi:RimJ/RimL family protein N-acetyltransferase
VRIGCSSVVELAYPSPPLTDDAVALRPWREADLPSQLQIFADPFFRQFSDWQPANLTDARQNLADNESARLRGEQLDLALTEPCKQHIVLGGVSLHHVNLTHIRGEVGYWLAPAARGRGIATDGLRLIVQWAFNVVGLARLELTCGPDNHASQRVAERCGFVREGLLRSHVSFKGGRRDSLVYGLLPDELRSDNDLR